MNTLTKRIALLGVGIAASTAAWAQGLVVNEFSNGTGGNQEYYEYVVVGPTGNPNCGPIDIRGWIIDDNNGDFSCGPITGVGIAPGHVKFSNSAVWAAVPTGSLILVYNDAVGEKNTSITLADDPTDANLDLVYVLPISSALLERTSAGAACPLDPADAIPMGCSAACPATGSSAYLPSAYAVGALWGPISMANPADAAQTRRPNGSYFHGFAYGSATIMNGGPDGLHMAGTGADRYFALTNGTSTNFRLLANWTRTDVALGGETPGFGNNVANSAWIASLQVICPLPVTYAEPLTAIAEEEGNVLKWSTASETNTSHYEVMRSESVHGEFINIGNLEAAYNSREKKDYEFLDAAPLRNAFYRLAQVDATGVMTYSNTVEVFRGSIEETALRYWPHPTAELLNFEVKGTGLNRVVLYDAVGRLVQKMEIEDGITVVQGQFDLSGLQAGVFILEASSSKGSARQKIVHVR